MQSKDGDQVISRLGLGRRCRQQDGINGPLGGKHEVVSSRDGCLEVKSEQQEETGRGEKTGVGGFMTEMESY